MDETEVMRMHVAGMKAPAIAAELEVSVSTIRAILRKSAKPIAPKAIDEDTLVSMYASGSPVGDILKEYGISYATLYRVLAARNVPTRATTNAPGRQKQLETAVVMYKEGAPLWSILNETGISQPVLHNALHRLEVPLRRPRVL